MPWKLIITFILKGVSKPLHNWFWKSTGYDIGEDEIPAEDEEYPKVC